VQEKENKRELEGIHKSEVKPGAREQMGEIQTEGDSNSNNASERQKEIEPALQLFHNQIHASLYS